jgi:hypothetical protein
MEMLGKMMENDGDRWGKDNEGTPKRMRRSKENKGFRWTLGCKEQHLGALGRMIGVFRQV